MKKFFLFAICFIVCVLSLEVSAHVGDSKSGEKYTCKRCDGTGYEPSMTKDCPYCNRGRVQHFRDCEKCWGKRYITNKYGEKEKCYNCDGAGKIYVDEECAYCDGTGSVRVKCMQCNGKRYVIK